MNFHRILETPVSRIKQAAGTRKVSILGERKVKSSSREMAYRIDAVIH